MKNMLWWMCASGYFLWAYFVRIGKRHLCFSPTKIHGDVVYVPTKYRWIFMGKKPCRSIYRSPMDPGGDVWIGIYTIHSGQIIATSHDLTPNGGLVREIPLFQGNLGWWNNIIWPDGFLAPPFTMAERKFRFIDFLDQAVCDLIGDGADSRKQQRVPISSAPSHWCDDLKEISKLLARWLDEQLLAKGCSARGHGRKKKQMSEMEKEHRSNLHQIVCYFRSVYEVLIDADERLSELLSPQDLLLHLRAMEHLEPLQLVPAIKYLVC